VIALANHTLLTPSLCRALIESGHADDVPQDVLDYLRFIHDRNRDRNLALMQQLRKAVSCLNEAGIVPVMLKGTVPLFLADGDRLPGRITSDLDIGIMPSEELAARAALRRFGYIEAIEGREMVPSDGGAILEPRPFLYESYGTSEHRHEGLRARIPSPASRALHWIYHDLLKEGDYWRGRIDLRHLHDLSRLAVTDRVDWSQVREMVPVGTVRNAVDTQLLAARHFFGIDVPAACWNSRLVRVQHWRRVFTATRPLVGSPMRAAGNVAWGTRRLLAVSDIIRAGPKHFSRRLVRALRDRRSKI
jgi:hypothetical protein